MDESLESVGMENESEVHVVQSELSSEEVQNIADALAGSDLVDEDALSTQVSEMVLSALGSAPEETSTVELVDRPFLTTPFEDYSVTEGFLLLLLVCIFISVCARLLKGGFSWL